MGLALLPHYLESNPVGQMFPYSSLGGFRLIISSFLVCLWSVCFQIFVYILSFHMTYAGRCLIWTYDLQDGTFLHFAQIFPESYKFHLIILLCEFPWFVLRLFFSIIERMEVIVEFPLAIGRSNYNVENP